MVNYLAVLVAAIAGYALGALWYSPFLFGRVWVKLMNFSSKQLKTMKKDAGKAYAIGFLSALVMSFVFAMVLQFSGTVGIGSSVIVALWLWLGFIATTQFGAVLWDGKPVQLWLLNTAHSLCALLIMALVLGAWR